MSGSEALSNPNADSGEPDTSVSLSLPARTDMAATLRVLVASLGADVGFTLDEIDDVRLAVNEVFSSVAEVGEAERFTVRFHPSAGSLRIEMHSPDTPGVALDELATTILQSVVDELVDDGDVITLSKRAQEAAE